MSDDRFLDLKIPVRKRSLTVPQQKAIKFLSETVLSNKEIAEKIGVSSYTLTNWQKDPLFQTTLKQEIDRVAEVDDKYRFSQIQKILPSIYKELQNRIVNGELSDISTSQLFKLMTMMQSEHRVDSKDFANVNKEDIDIVKERYARDLESKKVINFLNYKERGDK